MKEYTPKQIKELKANPYTLNVTKNKLYFTAKFKEDFGSAIRLVTLQEKFFWILDII